LPRVLRTKNIEKGYAAKADVVVTNKKDIKYYVAQHLTCFSPDIFNCYLMKKELSGKL